jgi:hypothetical protein
MVARNLNVRGPEGPLLFRAHSCTMSRFGYGQRMRMPQEPRLDTDNLQSALEASCDALMMVESARFTGDFGADGHVERAIESLRGAIDELRLARDEEASMVGLGFVVRADARRLAGPRSPASHASPRRTA